MAALITGAAQATPIAITDMRATYGGMALGLAVIFGLSATEASSVRKNKNIKHMRRNIWILLVNVLFFAATITSAYQDTSQTQFEFRLGQRQAVSGYVEMGFYKSTETAFVKHVADFVNNDIESATVETGGRALNEPIIKLMLTPEASDKFADFTEKNINKPLAVIINGKIMIMPVIRERITSGVVIIAGQFTKEEAEEFVNNLK